MNLDIGANVRAEMARQGVTQQQISAALGVPQSAVSARLRGTRAFRADELARLAELLGVSVARFYEQPAEATEASA